MRRASTSAIAATAIALLLAGPVTPATSAGPEPCTTYEFIGARGSGQDPKETMLESEYRDLADDGMGRELYAVYQGVEEAVLADGQTITPHGLRYPAPGVAGGTDLINGLRAAVSWGKDGAYGDSIAIGSAVLRARIEYRAAQCPDMTFVVTGYSQGAHAGGDGLAALPERLQRRVVAAAWFGDPSFNPYDAADLSSYDDEHHGAMGPGTSGTGCRPRSARRPTATSRTRSATSAR